MPNPFITGFPWAPDANYPAGSYAWSGQPTKVSPGYSAFQPSQIFAPTAQEMNAILNQLGSAVNYNANAVGSYRLVETLSFGATGGKFGAYFEASGWLSVADFTVGKEILLGALAVNTAAGDVVEALFASTMYFQNGSSVQEVDYALQLESSQNGAAYGAIPGAIAMRRIDAMPIDRTDATPVTLVGRVAVSTPGTFSVAVNGAVWLGTAGTPLYFQCSNGWSLTLRHWSPNP